MSKFPPRLWVLNDELALNCDEVSAYRQCGSVKDIQYISLEECEALLSEERAKIWEEASEIAFDKMNGNPDDSGPSIEIALSKKAKAERKADE